ncbi:hypothetical protein MAA5396_04768 [Marinovum algicola]|uniref:Uncharacterized protein n=1 Tax=Marinovum algicola TaxID=42444 RepID=A0A975WEM4_9RHOB|nr:hypothetical protein [Marinovum algicola]SEK08205.1 hypothetical protein SAMN04487940_12619 [Marinovum algicola]SLN76598.1 hypothetical protein MAA5396_04768 [Marinovum algicola]
MAKKQKTETQFSPSIAPKEEIQVRRIQYRTGLPYSTALVLARLVFGESCHG